MSTELLLKLVDAYCDQRIMATKGRADAEDVVNARSDLVAAIEELQTQNELLKDLLSEVSGNFTREDDLPDGLLGRIDAAIGAATLEGDASND